MNIATYFPDDGEFKSSTGIVYECRLQRDDHLFIAVALSRLIESEVTLQGCYESIIKNYDIGCVKFEGVDTND